VAAPSYEAVQAQLQHVAKKEALTLPPPFAARLAAASQRNLRRALLVMEVARVQQYPFKEDQRVPPLDWEQYVMVREEGKGWEGCWNSTGQRQRDRRLGCELHGSWSGHRLATCSGLNNYLAAHSPTTSSSMTSA
jgi:hypothetical protein